MNIKEEVGLIAVAVGIAVGLSPIWYILHGERKMVKDIQTQVNNTNNSLRQIITSGIDEKIAVFSIYVGTVQSGKIKRIMSLSYLIEILLID
jgi:hypothetical protein